MVWTIIERVIHLTTLVLLVLMITIIFTNNKSGEDRNNFSLKLEEFKQDNAKVTANNISYVEGRINRLAENQDNYQNTTSTRIYLIEKRVEKLEQGNKSNNKIINNNISNATINGLPVSPN